MDHRPFEDWLLENKELTSSEKRELNAHLQVCSSCCALAEVDLALKSVKAAPPAEGFTGRFQLRLEARKKAMRRRNIWGFVILAVIGLSVLTWISLPFFSHLIQSPVNLLASWLSALVSFWATAQALYQGGLVIAKVIPGFVPAYIWVILLFLAGSWSLLWVFSLTKFTKIPQGA